MRHDGAGNDAEVLFDGGPTLDGGDGELGGGHPAVDDGAELGHLHEGGFGGVADGDVLLDGGELGLDGVVVVFGLLDAAHDFGEVEGFDGDAGALEELLGVADGVEGGGTRADGAEANVAQAAHDAADGGEPLEVGLELGGVGGFGVQGGEGVGDAVLLEVVADGHLAAEGVAAEGDAHLAGGVGRGLDEDGDVEVGEAEGVGEAALFAEVWQGDDDAVDFLGVLLEELGALLGVFVGFDGPVRGLLRGEHDGFDAHGFKCCNHLQASAGGKVAGKKSTIAYDDAHCHLTTHFVLLFMAKLAYGLGFYFVDVFRTRPVTDGLGRWERSLSFRYFNVGLNFARLDFVALPTVIGDEEVAQERHEEGMVDSVVVSEVAHQHGKHCSADNRLHQQT